MSTTALSLSAQPQARAVHWTRFALRGPATVVAAVAANSLCYAVGSTVVSYDPQFLPLASVGGPIIMTVFPAIVAVLLYAALLRFTHHAARIFTITAAVVFVVTMIPVFTYIPTVPGASSAQSAILILMHVIAAGVIVRLLTDRRTSWAS